MWTDGNNPIFSRWPEETRPHILMNAVDSIVGATATGPCDLPRTETFEVDAYYLTISGWKEDDSFASDNHPDSCGGYVSNGDGSYTGTTGSLQTVAQRRFTNTRFLGCAFNSGATVSYDPNTITMDASGNITYTKNSVSSGATTWCTDFFENLFFIHTVPVQINAFFRGNTVD